MKTKYLIHVVLLASCCILLNACAGYGYSSCSSYYGCQPMYRTYDVPNCQCVDPDCRAGANDCLSQGRCCRAFGNIGDP